MARCTVERLMSTLGLEGARRGKKKRTTISDPQTQRAEDLVQRKFNPIGPNVLRVADFTYVSTWSGWVYVAFAIDAYSRRILGWRTSTRMTTPLVLDAIEHAIWTRRREGHGPVGTDSPPRPRLARRIQPVVATPCREAECNCSARTSAGVRHPSVLRGRLFSASATA